MAAVSASSRASGLPLMVLVGGGMTTLVVLIALLAPAIAHVPYDEQDLSRSLLPPFWLPGANGNYPLGTDFLGRDLLSRLVFGARTSLVVGCSAVLVSGAVGLTLGQWSSQACFLLPPFWAWSAGFNTPGSCVVKPCRSANESLS